MTDTVAPPPLTTISPSVGQSDAAESGSNNGVVVATVKVPVSQSDVTLMVPFMVTSVPETLPRAEGVSVMVNSVRVAEKSLWPVVST